MTDGSTAATLGGVLRGPTNVTIVGGGVAALEALIALRRLAEERVALELITPTAEWAYRPLAVAEPFGLGEAKRYDLVQIAGDHAAVIHLAGVESVDSGAHTLTTWDGRTLSYEILVVAVGADPTVAVPGSVIVKGPGYTSRFRSVLRELDERRIRRVAFAVPAGASWPLPLYELALMTAAHAAERGLRKLELSVITPEQEPLQLFGPAASSAVRALLDQRGIEFNGGRSPSKAHDGELRLVPGPNIAAERVVSLPRMRGPFLEGLPHDAEGFIPTDLHGLVRGEADVYAAGDATTGPIKQGGLTAQQADAAAEAIAARVGAPVEPRPFRPVMRGLLLTGAEPEFMRAEVSGGADRPPAVSAHALWWPPSKIAARWLAPYLAQRHDELELAPTGLAVEAEVPLPAVSLPGSRRVENGPPDIGRYRFQPADPPSRREGEA
jgi:sulfide:quinone oxidoreductase